MTASLHLTWGALPRSSAQHEATVTTAEELATVLDRIHAEALDRDLPQQVDAWAGSWRPGRTDPPQLPDPLVQFLLGHPERGSVRWNTGDDCCQAIDPQLPALPEPIIYDNGGAADPMDPDHTRLSPATTRQIVTAFLLTGDRPQDVTWVAL